MSFASSSPHDNPKRVLDLSIILDGNFSPNPFDPTTEGPAMRAPDNLGASTESLMVQEDTTSQVSRILRYDLENGEWSVVARVNDQDWESSGIVDVSAFFGPGTWLLDVQAHDVRVGPEDTTTTPGVTYKREGGQLILLTRRGQLARGVGARRLRRRAPPARRIVVATKAGHRRCRFPRAPRSSARS